MLIKAKSLKKLEEKVAIYKDKVVINYLNSRGYECDNSTISKVKVNNVLKTENKKVIIECKDEKLTRVGSYYVWEAYIKVKIINTLSGKEV